MQSETHKTSFQMEDAKEDKRQKLLKIHWKGRYQPALSSHPPASLLHLTSTTQPVSDTQFKTYWPGKPFKLPIICVLQVT